MFSVCPVALACLVVALPGTKTEIRPSFNLESAAWHASDIVVVREGAIIDGRVEVLDVWSGDCRVGHHLELEELAVFADEKLRRVFRWGPTEAKPILMSELLAASVVLNDRSGLDQITKQCDIILKKLD